MTSAFIDTHDNKYNNNDDDDHDYDNDDDNDHHHGDGYQSAFDLFPPANCTVARLIDAAENVVDAKTIARRLTRSTEDTVNTNCFEHKGLLEQLRQEEDASVLLLQQLTHERNNILELIDDISQQQQQQQYRFRCYMCLERVPLSLLVLNDLCRHSICRVCFSKVILEQATENILVDRSMIVNAPTAIDSVCDSSVEPHVFTTASAVRTTKASTSTVSVMFKRMLKPIVRTAKNAQAEREPNVKAVYACLACKRRNLLSGKLSDASSSVHANVPSVLAILSPGIEENSSDVGYRIHLLDNA